MEEDLRGFNMLYGVAQIFGLVALVLIGVWTSQFRGGFDWSAIGTRFNWHPLLMTIGFIFLYGNSILIYRVLRGIRKPVLKLIHAIIPVVILIMIAVAFWAVFAMHSNGVKHFYSVHSWVGLIAIMLFFLQWLSGLLAFLYPGAPMYVRVLLMPRHVYFGTAVFTMVGTAALTGLQEKSEYVTNYSSIPSEGLMVNFASFFILLYVATVVYIVTTPEYKRAPRAKDGLALSK